MNVMTWDQAQELRRQQWAQIDELKADLIRRMGEEWTYSYLRHNAGKHQTHETLEALYRAHEMLDGEDDARMYGELRHG